MEIQPKQEIKYKIQEVVGVGAYQALAIHHLETHLRNQRKRKRERNQQN